METGPSWLEVLLWPQLVERPPEGTAPSDQRLVDRLLLGHVHDVEVGVEAAGHERGLAALRDGLLVHTHPVATSLLQWMSEFGRSSDVANLLINRLPGPEPKVDRAADAILAAMALRTEGRFAEARATLVRAREGSDGIAWAALTAQLSLTLLEAGESDEAAERCREVIHASASSGDELLQFTRVALRNLQAATDFGLDRAEQEALQELSQITRAPDTESLALQAMDAVARDAVDVHLASAANPGWRMTNVDTDLFALLGTWLQHELWGDFGGVRAARGQLGAYAVAHDVLPFPDNWWHNVADASDLDLIRRSGDHRLTGAVSSRWWRAGPLDELLVVLDRVMRGPWVPPTVQCDLAVLETAGDLVSEDEADDLVTRVVDVAAEDRAHGFYAALLAARAVRGIVVVAGASGQAAAVQAVQSWIDDDVPPYQLRPLVHAIRYERMSGRLLDDFTNWASTLLAKGGAGRGLGVDALVRVSHTVDDRRPQVRDRLRAAFDAQPSLDLAAAVLRTKDPEGSVDGEIRGWLLSAAKRDGGEGGAGWSAHHLLAAAAEDEEVFAALRAQLLQEDASIGQLADTLVQLAARPAVASRVIDAQTVTALESRDPQERDPFRSDLRWTWVAAAMAAGAVDAEWALDWIATRLSDSGQAQWQAARVLGAAAQCVPAGPLSTLWLALVRSPHVEVAAEAADHAATLIDDAASDEAAGERVRSGLQSLLRRDGCLGPLSAGHALRELGWLDTDAVARLRSHPSGHVRLLMADDR